jgi:hypothetical protein
MKKASINHLTIGGLIITFLVYLLALQPLQAQALDSGYLEPSEKYNREELAQMLAPIALYPDALLSQVLMASTYPIEVIEADRWVKKNPEMQGDTLDDALLSLDWDPSVKALCHFPPVLALMSERIAETTNIGNAFLAQEDEVMEMIQELRAQAHAEGNLTTNSEQKVIVEKETIIIEPADPMVIYVPYYDPYYVYGTWWYPAYPPYYWRPSSVIIGSGISYWPGFYFGFTFGTWSYFDWNHHYIYIDLHKRPRFVRHDRWRPKSGRWTHASSHRRGVAYRDKSTARKFGQHTGRVREFRPDTRGYPERRDRDRSGDGQIRIDRDTRGDDRAIISRDKQERTRIAPDRENKQRFERPRQERPRTITDMQKRKPAVQGIQRQKQVERQPVKRSPETVFNLSGESGKERESSKRGRSSQQGLDSGSRSRSRSEGINRGGRDDRGRYRR